MAKQKKKVPARGPQCKCIAVFNKQYGAKNGVRLKTDTAFLVNGNSLQVVETMCLPLESLESGGRRKKKLPMIYVGYCPICGVKYKWKHKKKEVKPRARRSPKASA